MNVKKHLKSNLTSIKDLSSYASFSHFRRQAIARIIKRHPMSITPYYAGLIDWSDPDDPLRRMAVPDESELNISGSYDTGGEEEITKMPGLQHMYPQTALILATNRCSMYCRYCFRKRLIGLPSSEIIQKFESAARYISACRQIDNVLISGGDPFVLETAVIERLLKLLSPIRHLSFIRIGTRSPVTFPQRVLKDRSLLRVLRKYSLASRRIHIVTQFNHPREITREAIEACSRLLESGVIINNQTVLLKKVNNQPEVLADLQRKLTAVGVNPYYVFQCRSVKRVKYGYQDTLYRGYHIVEEAKRKLNGHAKRFKYVMSHRSGKIEILGITEKDIYFKYHQAKDLRHAGWFFKRRLNKKAGWLDELDQHKFLYGVVQNKIKSLLAQKK